MQDKQQQQQQIEAQSEECNYHMPGGPIIFSSFDNLKVYISSNTFLPFSATKYV